MPQLFGGGDAVLEHGNEQVQVVSAFRVSPSGPAPVLALVLVLPFSLLPGLFFSARCRTRVLRAAAEPREALDERAVQLVAVGVGMDGDQQLALALGRAPCW
ncbi:hypothetical protein E6W39_01150 [Kitasatospora acidiphila]|uniref:Uncharacterized protein n=1 Tax=Kitasatospora acidiphila TaxID=2567942 RepID=A0A540WG15_9ACTN|nr:hypothetical protein [Kitasatospora acidiphila]TQF07965.1 hypothetical protein E6W39_01150 [Kitasatospora acidiphila]